MNRFRMSTLAVALLISTGMLALPFSSNAGLCFKGSCNVTVSTIVWMGQPQLQCTPREAQTIRIDVTVCCPGCSSTQTFHRCANSKEPIQFTACGAPDTISLARGETWGDNVEDCDGVVIGGRDR